MDVFCRVAMNIKTGKMHIRYGYQYTRTNHTVNNKKHSKQTNPTAKHYRHDSKKERHRRQSGILLKNIASNLKRLYHTCSCLPFITLYDCSSKIHSSDNV